jgi:hypothetical protein
MEECWIYKGECLFSPPENENYYGFTYLITDLLNKKIYVGKKSFTHVKKTKLSKKAKLLPENKGKRVLRGTKDSGWLAYYGSCKELNEQVKLHGTQNFKREILEFAVNKSDLTLKEIEAQVKFNVLRVNSYNNWIGGKVYRRYLN